MRVIVARGLMLKGPLEIAVREWVISVRRSWGLGREGPEAGLIVVGRVKGPSAEWPVGEFGAGSV